MTDFPMNSPIIYTGPNCQACKQLKRFFQKEGIHFDELDVSTNEVAHRYLKERGYKTLPVTVIPGIPEPIPGFQPDAIRKAMAASPVA